MDALIIARPDFTRADIPALQCFIVRPTCCLPLGKGALQQNIPSYY